MEVLKPPTWTLSKSRGQVKTGLTTRLDDHSCASLRISEGWPLRAKYLLLRAAAARQVTPTRSTEPCGNLGRVGVSSPADAVYPSHGASSMLSALHGRNARARWQFAPLRTLRNSVSLHWHHSLLDA